ncbi:MAG: hypothetical protein IPQ08_05090 [Chitinophagaceae bacterium]|nr:hypothetical protein [Chitinophagaceae bacterium]
MKKTFFLAALVQILSIQVNSVNAQPAQVDAYKAAANAYRNAAAQTKCPERKQWLVQQADWNDCMVSRLGGSKTLCREITSSMPPCNADAGGNSTTTGNNGTTTGNSTNVNSSNLLEGANASLAFSSAYQAAINSGKKESGAMLNATLEAATKLSNPGSAKAVIGVGGLLSLISFLGEKKEEKIKAQKEAKEAAIQLFSENNKVLAAWEQTDFSHKTGTINVSRNKKGYVKGLEFTEGVKKFYDYVVVENSADSIRLVMVEQFAMGKNQNNLIDVIHEYRFSIRDITYCAYYEQREEFANLSDETYISYINPINLKAVANIIAEGDIGTSSTSLPTGIYRLQINLNAYRYRELECLPTQLRESFLQFFELPFIKSTAENLFFPFGAMEDGKDIYNIIKVFTY